MNYYLLLILLFSFTLLTSVIAQEYAFGFGENTLRWDENRKLTWGDFQGFTFASPYNAATSWNVPFEYYWESSNEGCNYKFSKILATANFEKSKSWVKRGQEADWLLNHEQGHFDMAQIFAEEFNERAQSELMGKEFSCPGGINNSNAINNQARNQVQSIFSQEHQKALQMNSRYDTETNHGMNNNKQIEWDKKIQSLLDVERQVRQIDEPNQEVDFLKQIIQDIQRFFISILDYKITI